MYMQAHLSRYILSLSLYERALGVLAHTFTILCSLSATVLVHHIAIQRDLINDTYVNKCPKQERMSS